MHKLIFIIFFSAFVQAAAQPVKAGIFSIELKTIEGKRFAFSDPEQLFVIVFLSPTCPLSQKYTLALNELAGEYKGKVKLYGVFAETDPVAGEYEDFHKKYAIRFQLLADKKKQLVKALSATVTPECFVINKRQVVYHGAIDDWVIELGKTRKKALTSFVGNAVKSAMENKTPVPAYVKPVGCFID